MIACQSVFALSRPETLADFTRNNPGPYFERFNLHHYVPLDKYEEVYARYRAASAGKPMWVTEFNVTVDWADEKSQEPDAKNLRVQAMRLPKVFAKSLYEGVEAAFYFMLPHYVEHKRQYGILHRDLTPRPAFMALAAVGSLLADAKAVGRWDAGDPQVHAYVFRARPDGQEKFVIVAWSSGGEKVVSLNVPTEKVFDVLGRETQGSWIGQVKLANAPQFAVTNVDPSKSMKLTPPPEPPPLNNDKPSPVVLQVLWPDAGRDFAKSVYRVAPGEPTTVPLFLYNFSDRAVTGSLAVDSPADWNASLTATKVELQPGDRKELQLTITTAGKSPTTQPIRITGQFDVDGAQPVVSFSVAPATDPAK